MIRNTILLTAGLLLSALLFACGGAEDGDLTPPNFTIDSSVPSVTADPGSDVSPYLFFGTSDPGSEIDATVTFPTTGAIPTVTTPVVQPNGDWSFSLYGLAEGSNTIAIDVSDAVGNSTVYYLTIVLDLTGPVVTIDQFRTPTPDSAQILAGTTGGELNVKVQYRIDGGVWMFVDDVNADIWYVDHDFITDSLPGYLVEVRGCDSTPPLDIDNCGNYTDAANYASKTIVVDSATPAPMLTVNTATLPATAIPGFAGVVPYIHPNPSDQVPVVTFNGTREPDYIVSSSITSGIATAPTTPTSTDWTAEFSGFVAGNNVAAISIDDGTGVDTASASFLVIRDLTAANVTETTPAHGNTVSVSLSTISVVFSESMDPAIGNIDASNLTVTDESGATIAVNSVVVTDILNRVYDFSIGPLEPNGTYTVNLNGDTTYPIADASGNPFSGTYTWTFKTN